jgi:hypothetical protein
MATRIRLRRGTDVQWASANPILALGEFGYESNTERFKIGDGNTPWLSLSYNEQIITLTGDVTGSGNGLINVTVIDDSHNHTTATLPNFTEDVQDVAGGMVTGNVEEGITVTYDDNTGKLNFSVSDPIITIAGDVAGSATMTNLGNTTINVTVQPDSVALGTDTTGDYVKTITGTTNQVAVTGSGTESRDVTLSTPQDIHSGATPSFVGIQMPNSKIVSDVTTITSNNTPTTLDTFDVASYTTSEYVLQMKQGSKMTSEKILVVWDGTDVHLNEYSIIDATSGGANAFVSASYDSGVVTVTASSPDASSTSVQIKAATTYIAA